jgi:HD-like signal output (HDOD) protein
MKRVLFVDDEQQVLDGLRDMLRKQRKHWDMVFALGGPAAVEELEKRPFDVVVSDMRMPVIDGAALLTRVKEQYPASARIILSGHAEREAVVRALPVSHQFLSKPCDAALLQVVVERACELQALLGNENIRQVIGKLDKLPSVPQTYWELTQAAARHDVVVDDLAEVVERDPAMVVKVLQLVNSGYFGLPQRITSVRHAASYLGTELLKALALTAHAFGTSEVPAVDGFSLEGLQRSSLQSARLVKRIVTDPKQANDAFAAAMVHDIGQIVLSLGVPEVFGTALRRARVEGRPAHVFEREALGVTHAEVGAYLLGFWGLPLAIVEAVAYHNAPGLLPEGPTQVLAAVHIADALLSGQFPRNGPPPPELLDMEFISRAGFADRMTEFAKMAEGIAAIRE